jgi:hypothetical protein
VGSACLPSFEGPPQRRLRGHEAVPQVQRVGEIAPTFGPGPDVDIGEGGADVVEFAKAVRQTRFV